MPFAAPVTTARRRSCCASCGIQTPATTKRYQNRFQPGVAAYARLMAIETVSARRCVVPLDRPLHLGDAVVAHRDYVIVEVTTSDGVVGRAIGNARNSPVHLFVRDVIAPLVVGLDPLRTENVWSRMYYGCLPIGQRGALMTRAQPASTSAAGTSRRRARACRWQPCSAATAMSSTWRSPVVTPI